MFRPVVDATTVAQTRPPGGWISAVTSRVPPASPTASGLFTQNQVGSPTSVGAPPTLVIIGFRPVAGSGMSISLYAARASSAGETSGAGIASPALNARKVNTLKP